jgi:S1-C subfamily serine protease
MRRRRLLASLPLLALPAACAAPAAREAAGTPAAAIAAESFAAVFDPEAGRLLGAAVAIAPGIFVTNAHVAGRQGRALRLQRGDGRTEAEAVVARLSGRVDLALLRAPEEFAHPVAVAPGPPRAGDPVWALGPHRLGRSVAPGRVATPAIAYEGFGQGFTAQLGALMGFSGGPVVDRHGRLAGLTTAMPAAGGAGLLAALSGFDLDGLTRGERRLVFVLGAEGVMAEVARLAEG